MRAMKDSGVEWIGEIPEEWICIKNKYLLDELYSGGTPTATNDGFYCYENGTPFVAISDMSNTDYVAVTQRQLTEAGIADKQLKKLPVGTILYSIYATVGAISELKIEAAISQAMLALKLDDHVNKDFYKYNLRAMKDYIFSQANGNTQFNLNADKVRNFYFTLPAFEEQMRIADYLDAKCAKIDAIIAKQQAIIEKLKAYKLSVITEAVTKGLNPDVPMKDSGVEWIGKVPEHWGVPKIKYLASLASGGTPDRNHPEYWNGMINWIKTGELQNAELYEAEETITELALEYSSAKVFPVNTILMAMYGQGKTRGMTALLKTPCATNQACAAICVNNPNVIVEYLWTCLMGAYTAIRERANGSGQPNLSAALIGDFEVTLPTLDEQIAICDYIKARMPSLDAAIQRTQFVIEKMTEYKKSLIYEVVTGKREV